MHDDLKSKLERYLPIRVVVRHHEGAVEGLVEHSFAMAWQKDRVNIFWSGKAYSMLGEHQLDGTKDAAHNCKKDRGEMVIDPLAADSPIEIDWESWLADLAAKRDKFVCRNAKFTTRPHGQYMLRALNAERELAALKPLYEERGRVLNIYQEQEARLREVLEQTQD